MPVIPSELIRHLHEILARCSALDSDRALRSVFIDPRLAPWFNRVPENTPDRATRVALLIATLWDKADTQGDNALLLFLNVLAESTSIEDALHDELLSLGHALKALLIIDSATFTDTIPTSAESKSITSGNQTCIVDGFLSAPIDTHTDHYETIPSLSASILNRRDFYQHIPLPPHYVPRPDVVDAVRALLLSDYTCVVLTSTVQSARHNSKFGNNFAMQGTSGTGKSVIARALCDDPVVQTTFPDGILWTTLGRDLTETSLHRKLREWAKVLGGGVTATMPTIDQLKNELQRLLETRACLLIVDDVWQCTQTAVFQVGGTRCRLLITTRDAEVAHNVDAAIYPIETLQQEQAVMLLEQWAEGHLTDAALGFKQQIVTQLDCLPLSLLLTGAQLRYQEPEHWLEAFNCSESRRHGGEPACNNLERTLIFSLNNLSTDERRCYTALAIFKGNEYFPFVAIAKLWKALVGLTEAESAKLLDNLADCGLLQISIGHAEKHSDEESRVILHDLLRDFIVTEMGEPGIIATHRALINTYRQNIPVASSDNADSTLASQILHPVTCDWSSIPDDGYLYAHLAYHLDAAGEYAELRKLFLDDTWLHVRVAADDYVYDGYLEDLALAWEKAKVLALSSEEIVSPLAAADCIHYALIHTSISTLTNNYVPALVARAMETGLWSPGRVISVVRRLTDVAEISNMVVTLLKTKNLPNTLRAEIQHLALKVVRAIEDEEDRMIILLETVPYLTDDLAAEGFAEVCAIEDEEYRSEILGALAPRLTGQLVSEALATARAMEGDLYRATVIVALAPQLTGDLLAEGLAVARTIEDEMCRAWVWATLSTQLKGEMQELALTTTLATIRAIADEEDRLRILAMLRLQLTGKMREKVLAESLAMALAISNELYRAWALAELAPHLTGERRELALAAALATARTIEDGETRASLLSTLTPDLAQEMQGAVLTEVLEAVRAIAYEKRRIWLLPRLLAEMAPRLTGKTRELALTEALVAARAVQNKEDQVEVLAMLAPQFTRKTRELVLTEALAATKAIRFESHRAETLAALAPQLTETLLTEGLAIARTIGDAGCRITVLAALALQLTRDMREPLLTEGLVTARLTDNREDQTEILAILAPQLTGSLLTKALMVTHAVVDPESWMEVLLALAPKLTHKTQETALKAILATVRTMADEENRAEVLVELAPLFTESLLTEGLAAAQTIEDERDRAKVLIALAPQFRESRVTEALAIARAVEDKSDRAEILTMLAPQLTGEARKLVLAESLAAVRTIENEWCRAKALETLAPQLTGSLLTKALAVVYMVKNESLRAGILEALAPQLTGSRLVKILTMARSIVDEKYRARVLIELFPRLTEDLLIEGLAATREIENEKYRTEVLVVLAPQLTVSLLPEVLVLARAIKNEWYRAKVFIALAPQLKGPLLTKALAMTRAIKDEKHRVWALAALAPQLKGNTRKTVLIESLVIARTIADEEDRAQILVMLIPHFTEPLLTEGLLVLRAIIDKRCLVWALAELARQFTGDSQVQTLVEALMTARAIEDKGDRLEALMMLALSTDIPAPVLADIRRALFECLFEYHQEVQDREEVDLFWITAAGDLDFLRALGISLEGFDRIAQSITAIYTQWDWL